MPHPPRHRCALVAVLPLAVLTLVLGGCGGGGEPTPPRTTTVTVTPTPTGTSTTATTTTTTTPTATPPKTYAQALQHFAAATVDAGAKPQFTSPTGNIFCSIAASGDVPPGCEVRDGRITPPAGACDTGGGGAAKDVGRIEWSGDTPKPICNSDTMIQPGVPVLQYGSIAKAQGSPFQCLSESIGMTCVNTAGQKGFFLAKGAYTVF